MQLKQLELTGGGTLTVYLRVSDSRMPNAMERPLVLVVPGGGYNHVSLRMYIKPLELAMMFLAFQGMNHFVHKIINVK